MTALAATVTLSTHPAAASAAPPISTDIHSVKFSPDGKYALAQDDANVYVLTHNPFAQIFRVESSSAQPAWFSTDSKQVIIVGEKLKVQVWDVATQQKVTDTDGSTISAACLQTKVSPDAKSVACLTPALDFRLYDLQSGKVLLTKKDFYQRTSDGDCIEVFLATAFTPRRFDLVRMEFSPDSTSLLVARSMNPTQYEIFNPAGIGPFANMNALIEALKSAVQSNASASRSVAEANIVARTGMSITALNDPVAKAELLGLGVPELLTKQLADGGSMAGLNFATEEATATRHAMDAIAVNAAKPEFVPLRGVLRDFSWGPIVYVANDELVAVNSQEVKKSIAAKYPAGTVTHKLELAGQWITASANGDFIFVHPVQGAATGIYDWKNQKFTLSMKSSTAVDALAGEFITPTGGHALSLFDLATAKFKQKLELGAAAH